MPDPTVKCVRCGEAFRLRAGATLSHDCQVVRDLSGVPAQAQSALGAADALAQAAIAYLVGGAEVQRLRAALATYCEVAAAMNAPEEGDRG